MKKIILSLLYLLFATCSYAQITKEKELFKTVNVINNKVAFIKEVQVSTKFSEEDNFNVLKEWARQNYGNDPFISSVRYDFKKHEIVAKSRIELVLPANSQGVREKMVMRYRVNGFLIKDKCVLEVTDISYLHENARDKRLPRVIRAEDFVTDTSIATDDNLKELKINAKKSTLYFLNGLGTDFEKLYGH